MRETTRNHEGARMDHQRPRCVTRGARCIEVVVEIDPDGTNEITALCTSPTHVVVARARGEILRFSLPSMELENTYTFYGGKPVNIKLSSNSSRLSVIDSSLGCETENILM